jgi:hypothetical protein
MVAVSATAAAASGRLPPPPQACLDLQATNAQAACRRKRDRDAPVLPARHAQHVEHGIRDGGGQRIDQLIQTEFPDVGRGSARTLAAI